MHHITASQQTTLSSKQSQSLPSQKSPSLIQGDEVRAAARKSRTQKSTLFISLGVRSRYKLLCTPTRISPLVGGVKGRRIYICALARPRAPEVARQFRAFGVFAAAGGRSAGRERTFTRQNSGLAGLKASVGCLLACDCMSDGNRVIV